MQRVEVRETGHFSAVTPDGLTYTLVERTQVTYVTYPDRSKRSIPGEKTYQTINGLRVNKIDEKTFEIASSGVKLTRT